MAKPSGADRIIVVGAGASGLSLAIELGRLHHEHSANGKKNKLHITLLEATASVGGRIRTIRTKCNDETPSSSFLSLASSRQEYWKRRYEKFYPFHIPLGAEFVHGDENNSTVMDRVIRNQLKKQQLGQNKDNIQKSSNSHEWELELVVDYSNKSPNLTIFADGLCFHWYDGSTVHKEDNDSPWSSYIDKAKKIWAQLLALDEEETDRSLADFVLTKYSQIVADEKDEQECVLSILNAVYAATAATTSDLLGIKETSRQENAWSYGERNFRSGGCYSELVDELLMELELISNSPDVAVDIMTNCPVQEISFNSNDNSVKLECSNQSYECDCVGVTVPLAVLNSGQLRFTGDCVASEKKQNAIKAINVLGGGKVHALIKWGIDLEKPQAISFESLQGIFVCPEEAFKQIWFRWNHDSILVTGFCVFSGRTAFERDPAHLEASLKNLVVRILSKSLQGDVIPRNNDGNQYLTFSAFDVHDWSKDKYAQGMYSSPSISSSRQLGATSFPHHLAEPISQRVYFAGEHTNTEAFATVQSALESGIRAAHEIHQQLRVR